MIRVAEAVAGVPMVVMSAPLRCPADIMHHVGPAAVPGGVRPP